MLGYPTMPPHLRDGTKPAPLAPDWHRDRADVYGARARYFMRLSFFLFGAAVALMLVSVLVLLLLTAAS